MSEHKISTANGVAPAMFGRTDVEEAYGLIGPYLRKTPVMAVDGGDFGTAGVLTLKLELLQHTSSFKPRGAFTNLLTREIPQAGVVAASGGNHGAAVAYAAHVLGIPAKIFVPTVSPKAKIDRIRSYGAELEVTGDRYADALKASEDWIAETGALAIHAYDQMETLIGQATTGLEFEEQAPELDTVLVAVGGGGFIGGIAAWYGGRTKVVGVEPKPPVPSMLRSKRAIRSMSTSRALPPTASGRAVSAGSCIRSPAITSITWCWSPMTRSGQPRSGYGRNCASSPSRAAPRPWPQSFPAATSRPRANASASWSAAATRMRSILGTRCKISVAPAKAGAHWPLGMQRQPPMDSRFRGNDEGICHIETEHPRHV